MFISFSDDFSKSIPSTWRLIQIIKSALSVICDVEIHCNECNECNVNSSSVCVKDDSFQTTIPSQKPFFRRKLFESIDLNIPSRRPIPFRQSTSKELAPRLVVELSLPVKRVCLTLRPPKKRVQLFLRLRRRLRTLLVSQTLSFGSSLQGSPSVNIHVKEGDFF